jgi:hypothetical protein
MLLFLDFDGVLHPDEVYLTRKGPELRAHGSLFMWASALETELAPHPYVPIVLSTSWVRHLGFHRTKKYLPEGLQARVIGSTWHSAMAKDWADRIWWDRTTRHGQILRYIDRAGVADWLAIDDDDESWARSDRSRLVLTDGEWGLSKPETLLELRAKLKAK